MNAVTVEILPPSPYEMTPDRWCLIRNAKTGSVVIYCEWEPEISPKWHYRRSTPILKLERTEEFTRATTKSGSVYVLMVDREVSMEGQDDWLYLWNVGGASWAACNSLILWGSVSS